MVLSDKIESFIIELLKDGEEIELKRNELADVFKCVPSQINYVITTRFNNKRGYIVESRRGGGGYIRIKRIEGGKDNLFLTIVSRIGDELDFRAAEALLEYLVSEGELSEREAGIILCAVNDKNFSCDKPERDRTRANIFKNTLTMLSQDDNK